MEDKTRFSKTKTKTDLIPSSMAPDLIKAGMIKDRQGQKNDRKPRIYTLK